MKWLAGLAVTGLFAVPALADPEVPAVSRDVAMVVDEQFTHPIIPPTRTSPERGARYLAGRFSRR